MTVLGSRFVVPLLLSPVLSGVSTQQALRIGLFATGELVSFASGLNDTPKIVGILVAAGALALAPGMALVAIFVLLGDLLLSRRVAKTMAENITSMDACRNFCRKTRST
jgi:PiT family inorganic phosphate transporter